MFRRTLVDPILDQQKTKAMTDNQINTTAIFGEVKRRVLSKEFTYGNLTNIFGKTTIDFRDADIKGIVVLNCTQAFGQIKIKAPANWQIVSEVTNFFMVVDDKRKNPAAAANSDKVLVLQGGCFFAAIDIVDCKY
jgi:hypothetical protein